MVCNIMQFTTLVEILLSQTSTGSDDLVASGEHLMKSHLTGRFQISTFFTMDFCNAILMVCQETSLSLFSTESVTFS